MFNNRRIIRRRDTADSRRISFSDWPADDGGAAAAGGGGGFGGGDHEDHDYDRDEDPDLASDRHLDHHRSPPPAVVPAAVGHAAASGRKLRPSSSPFGDGERKASIAGSAKTAALSSSNLTKSSLTSSSSRADGGNVWTRLLLGGRDANWDKLDGGGGDVWEDDDDGGGEDGGGGPPGAIRGAATTLVLTAWYEARHFLGTVRSNPRILLTSLATFGVLCGVGMAAINAERDAYVQKQKGTAEFVVRRRRYVRASFFAGSPRHRPVFFLSPGCHIE